MGEKTLTPSVLTIAGSDSCGGAGIQADLKTFLSFGVHGASVLTAITAQNTRGVRRILPVPAELVREQLRAVLSDLHIEWAKTGMLYSSEIVKVIIEETRKIKLVVDPVLLAATGASLAQEDLPTALKTLISRSHVVTPNVKEAEILTGCKIETLEDAIRAAKKLARDGPAVVLKGGHLKGKKVVDVLVCGRKIHYFERERVRGKIHGSGCVFSAALTALLAKGKELVEAVEMAGKFVHENILHRMKVGRGMDISSFWQLEKNRAIVAVYEAAQLFVSSPESSWLIPEVGINLVMALPNASSCSEVVGLSGRIIRVDGVPRMTGFPKLGGSEHVANAVLTMMKYDPNMRAGMNIKYWDGAIRACKRLGLKIAEFRREDEPEGVKTMRWGIADAIEKFGGVPNIIFDRGAPGKEPMIRIFGRDPMEVVRLALKLGRAGKKRWGESAPPS